MYQWSIKSWFKWTAITAVLLAMFGKGADFSIGGWNWSARAIWWPWWAGRSEYCWVSVCTVDWVIIDVANDGQRPRIFERKQ